MKQIRKVAKIRLVQNDYITEYVTQPNPYFADRIAPSGLKLMKNLEAIATRIDAECDSRTKPYIFEHKYEPYNPGVDHVQVNKKME